MMTRRTTIAAAAASAAALSAGSSYAAGPAPQSRLGPLRGVTTTAADLKVVEEAYAKHLEYRTVHNGALPADMAAAWNAPALAGKPTLVMEPATGEQTLLRFVEQPMPADFKPMTTYGWASTEIILKSCDVLAEKLAGTPFRMVSPPTPLGNSPNIKAFQAIGPANEMLYLTSIEGPLPGRDMPKTTALVGRCFIAVAGMPDRQKAADWYLQTFGNTTGKPMTSRIRSLSRQNDLPVEETVYELSVTECGDGTKIELDQYLDFAKPRPVPAGGLPLGMAMVSFECAHFDDFVGQMIAPPAKSAFGPHKGARIGVMRGLGGELIELVEV